MGDKSELQHIPRAVDALVLSEARSSLIARARKDATSLMESRPLTMESTPVEALGTSVLSNDVEAEEQFHNGLISNSGQDYVSAAFWFRKAAEKGHTRAGCALGLLYCKGQGVPQDNAKAIDCWRKAAEQGEDNALYYLTLYSVSGALGTPNNYAEGYFWASLAVARTAGHDLAPYVEIRDGCASKLTLDQLSKVQTQVSQWLVANQSVPQKCR